MAACLLTVLSACGGGGEGDDAGSTVDVHGWAHAGGPLAGAQVRLLTLDGRELGRAGRPTYATGTWHMRVRELPAEYTVEVTGGADAGQPFKGKLLHTERAHSRFAPVAVNPATTLAAHYQALHPELPMAEADAAVRKFLSLPDRIEIDRHLRASDIHFSGARFIGTVPAGVSFDDHVQSMAKQVDSGQPRTYAATRRSATVASARSAATVVAADIDPSSSKTQEDAARVLLGAATGGPSGTAAAIGNILISDIFGGTSPSAQMISLLLDISKKLDAVASDLHGLQVVVNRVEQRVNDLAYTNRIQPLLPVLNDIDILWELYTHLMQSDPGDSQGLNDVRSAFMAAMDVQPSDSSCATKCRMKQAFDLRKIQQVLVGDVLSPGALELWNVKVLTGRLSGSKRFVTASTQEEVQAAFKFWRTAQVKLYVLLKEYGHAVQATDPSFLNPMWTQWYGTTEGGTRFVEQSVAADHVDKLTPLKEYFLYDRHLGAVWPGALTNLPVDIRIPTNGMQYRATDLVHGDDLAGFYARALVRMDEVSELKGWQIPSRDHLSSLTHAVDQFDGPSSANGDKAKIRYLLDSGFAYWLGTDDWDGWTYASAEGSQRKIVNLATGELADSCDAIVNCSGGWRLTPGGFLPVRFTAAGERFMPDGW